MLPNMMYIILAPSLPATKILSRYINEDILLTTTWCVLRLCVHYAVTFVLDQMSTFFLYTDLPGNVLELCDNIPLS